MPAVLKGSVTAPPRSMAMIPPKPLTTVSPSITARAASSSDLQSVAETGGNLEGGAISNKQLAMSLADNVALLGRDASIADHPAAQLHEPPPWPLGAPRHPRPPPPDDHPSPPWLGAQPTNRTKPTVQNSLSDSSDRERLNKAALGLSMGHDDSLTGGETGYWAGLMPIGAAARHAGPDGGQITPAGSARDAGGQ